LKDPKIKHIIYFDGVCNLCHWSVKFILKRDKENKFRFAPLQSDFAASNLQQMAPFKQGLDTVIYQRNNSYYHKSKAVLRILVEIGGFWKIFSIFNIIPVPMLNKLYDFIASQRYNWFGRQKSCIIPTPELKDRFLG